MIECDICFEKYKEGDLGLHQQTCVVRLMFRCSICNEDYVSREGLWNHLALHEIDDDSKDLRCQELKAKYKFYKCALCNDERGYSASSYEIHVRDIHEHVRAQDEMVVSGFKVLVEQPLSIEAERMADDERANVLAEKSPSIKVEYIASGEEAMEQLREPQNDQLYGEDLNQPTKQSLVAFTAGIGNNNNSNKSELPITEHKSKRKKIHSQVACDNCGKTFSRKSALARHKTLKICIKDQDYVCPTCEAAFKCRKDFIAHYKMCKQMVWLCNLCGSTFARVKSVTQHNMQFHPQNGNATTRQLVQRDVHNKDVIQENRVSSASDNREQSAVDDLGSPMIEGSTTKSNDNIVEDGRARKEELKSGGKKQSVARKVTLPFTCPICGITLFTYAQITHHRLIKHTEPKFECSKCSKKFYMKKYFVSHVASCGSTKPVTSAEHVCDMCGKKFYYLGRLAVHKRKVHHVKRYTRNVTRKTDSTSKDQLGSKSNHAEVEAATCLENGIQLKEEPLELMEEINIELQNPAESSKPSKACPICGLCFKERNKLWYHKTVAHGDPQYECTLCWKKFHFAAHLRVHMKGCSELRCYKCNIKFFNRSHLDIHNFEKHPDDSESKDDKDLPEKGTGKPRKYEARVRNQAGDLVFPCSICHINFVNIWKQRYHVKIHHSEARYKCSICQKGFHIGTTLRRHEKTCAQLRCYKCGIKFSTRVMLNKHNANEHPEDSESKDDEGSQKDRMSNRIRSRVLNKAGVLVWPCSFCKLTFETIWKQRYHMKRHHLEPKYKCSYCQKAFHVDTILHRHEKGCSETRCRKCGIKFPRRHLLKKHILKKHVGDENLRRNGIGIKSKYEARYRNEAGDLVWPCSICNLTFDNKWKQKYHVNIHHVEAKYECSICHKTFHLRTSHRVHEKTCLQRRCHKCDITFRTRTLLNYHNVAEHNSKSTEDKSLPKYEPCERNEAGDQIWPCSLCKLTFETKLKQRYHVRTRHSKGIYNCSFCQKKFYIEKNLRRHEKACSQVKSHTRDSEDEQNVDEICPVTETSVS